MIYRIFVEKKEDLHAQKLKGEIFNLLNIDVTDLKRYIRYDVDGLSEEEFNSAVPCVFSEPPVDNVYYEEVNVPAKYSVFAVAYLNGQYDQRADSAAQCVQLLTRKHRPLVKCAMVYAVAGVGDDELAKIKKHLINPVESEEVSLEKPQSLLYIPPVTKEVEEVEGFLDMDDGQIAVLHDEMGLAMSVEDLRFVRDYFVKEGRTPTETEVRVIDTYWSDHCRHTTFLTEFKDVKVNSANPHVLSALNLYRETFTELYMGREDKYPCLMNLATIAANKLKNDGKLNNLDVSDEINACAIKVDATIDGEKTPYTIMFKNETHNHPTEIEPFGGAATCLGGAIRDPLSGRAYVVQAMRVSGSGDPTEPIENTAEGKLPQRVISTTAAAGFSSYGNQIGLATGQVEEIYHPGYKAKRLEAGFVVGGAKSDMIRREAPVAGDVIILIGGETGRDGCGGATGSSKAHTVNSVKMCGAEVQKGNALTERKLQRLFLNKEATSLVKRCNDFGAGGVSVAIGELAAGLDIDLDKVPKKYKGLSGTELAISESQERMAVVVAADDADKFIALASEENLTATVVATVTDDGRMKMLYQGKPIVDIARSFLDTNGVKQAAEPEINEKVTGFFTKPAPKSFKRAFIETLSDLNVCSKKGLSENFDSTIGAKSVYMPFGGKYQLTPAIAMASKFVGGETDDCTVSAYGYNPELMSDSPFTGAIYSIVGSISKVVACGAKLSDVRLTLQEYFMRLRDDKKRWGVPVSALLGAMYAQLNLGVGAIGGKDSMSGSFEDLDVPPTLVSFALAPAKASKLVTNVLKEKGQKLYLLSVRKDGYQTPVFAYLKNLYSLVNMLIVRGQLKFATVVEKGGAAAAVAKSCFGNGLGFKFECDLRVAFKEGYGDIIVCCDNPDTLRGYDRVYLGETTDTGFTLGDEKITSVQALNAYTSRLNGVFPATAPASGKAIKCDYKVEAPARKAKVQIVKPRVFIPAFPGTNCELDTARAFEQAGADPHILVIKNRNAADIEDSVRAIMEEIDKANIIAFPGGFSGGDEPDGSGKFIATTFQSPAIAERVYELLHNRDGLILGICNGFQALIKLGLLPYGEVRPLDVESPTLTYNNISRHVSTMAKIRVASTLSPWLSACKVGDIFSVPVSHGEGKLVASQNELRKMQLNGQIATQYVDLLGAPTMQSPYNPNGSLCAIEGITSPDGRVFGKMGHSERKGANLYKNYDGQFDMKIFESGVKYFK